MPCLSLRGDTARILAAAAEARRAGRKRIARTTLNQARASRIFDETMVRQFRDFLRSHPATARAIAMDPGAGIVP